MSVKPSSEAPPGRLWRGLWVAALAAAVTIGWALRDSTPQLESERAEATPPRVEPEAAALGPVDVTVKPATAIAPVVASHAAVDPMTRLRALVDVDPAAALALAEEEARGTPGGPFAEERSFRSMQALVHLGRIAAARDEATAFFERFPESPWGERVERLTGVHPRRSYQNPR